MPDFSRRSTEAELMDDLNAPEHELRQNLRELEVVNEWLGGYSVILNVLSTLEWPNNKTVSIMDLGCGGGDTLRAIAKWSRKRKRTVSLTGIDWNPVMTSFAAEHSAGDQNIEYRTLSIFDEALDKDKADIVMCSLFCHHFEHNALVKLVQRMRQLANSTVIINDLHRHWFAYYSIAWLTALFSKTYMVKNDAKVSVARAFTRADIVKVMSDAGIKDYTLKWRWAFRWEIVVNKD